MFILENIVAAVIGYLLGSINSSIIVSKYIYGADIRNFGSGNAGATNTLRTFGKFAAFLVILGDVLKGVLSVLIGQQLSENAILIAALACILGHNWPIYFKFKGGKGILTSISIIITLDWRIGLILAIIGIAVIAITRYVSLGSIIGCILLPIIVKYLPNIRNIPQNEFFYFSIIICVVAISRHYKNIIRLVQGKESKIGQKVSDK